MGRGTTGPPTDKDYGCLAVIIVIMVAFALFVYVQK